MMLDFYTFVTTVGKIVGRVAFTADQALDEARNFHDSGAALIAILKGGKTWLEGDALRAALQ
jgi:hypothetical protein